MAMAEKDVPHRGREEEILRGRGRGGEPHGGETTAASPPTRSGGREGAPAGGTSARHCPSGATTAHGSRHVQREGGDGGQGGQNGEGEELRR